VSVGSVLVFPLLWSLWATAGRVGRATNSPPSFPEKLLIVVVLSPLIAFVYAPWLQEKLNRFGREVQAAQREATLRSAQLSAPHGFSEVERERVQTW
jgi:hypothetical protein